MSALDTIYAVERLLRAWRGSEPPNLVKMTPAQYQELEQWCRATTLADESNPITMNRLRGMEIETHSGPLQLARDDQVAPS